jgi:hypothetical protein
MAKIIVQLVGSRQVLGHQSRTCRGNILIGVRILPARIQPDPLRIGASVKAHVKKYKTVGQSDDVSQQLHQRAWY